MRQDGIGGYRSYWKAYAFLLPIFALIATFKYVPFVSALLLSFFDSNGANVKTYVGLQNFRDLLHDPLFYTSIRNMLLYVAGGLVIQFTLPLLASLLVFHVKNTKLQNMYKTWFLIPLVVPGIVVYLMWQWMYSGDFGIINEFLKAIGLESLTHAWLGESKTALGSILFINFPWVGGITFLLYLTGLISIPGELFEMATLEGAGAFRRLVALELPLLRSQMKLVLILTILQQSQWFENILVLTNGGPGSSTLSPALYLYMQGFSFDKYGYASAIGVVLFALLLVLTAINQRFVRNADKLD